MNISISYNWLKEFLPTTLSPDEFASRMSTHGPSVERVHRLHESLDGIVVGRVVDVRPHPNADKLRLASVDVGKEIVDVVCGGSNLTAGMKVAFARIGARVRWHGEGELVELKPAEIRGVKSFGMICAANEIGLADLYPHAEREIMDVSSVARAPGTPLGAALGLDDAIFDIEVTTNRIDAFSVKGMAREAAAILSLPHFTSPVPGGGGKKKVSSLKRKRMKVGDAKGILVAVQAKHLCPRYQAAVIRGVRVGMSPVWMKQRLLASGIRPINSAVDVANYVMLEVGQPLHTFDASKLARGMIVVREARDGETIAALNGKTYQLAPGMLVIADAERPIAIAGVVGSEESGVTAAATDIVIESAAFDPVSVRKTSRALGILSDAALRFEKDMHPESTAPALARAAELLILICGGTADSVVVDVRSERWKPRVVTYRPRAATDLAGVTIDTTTQRHSLEALGFGVKPAGKTWSITIPWWRDADIEEGERDLIEEVVRLYGYDRIPSSSSPPSGGGEKKALMPLLSERMGDREYVIEQEIREFFRGVGFLETQTLPLVPESWAPEGLTLENPLSSDAARLRTSLIPSLVDVIRANGEREPELRLFEISRIYLPRPGDLPEEPTMLIAVAAGPSPAGEQFAAAKGVLESLAARFHLPVAFDAPRHDIIEEEGLHPGRARAVKTGGNEVGFVAEINPFALQGIDERIRIAVLSLDLAHAFKSQVMPTYRDVPAFPAVKRDISFIVPERTKHADVVAAVDQAAAIFRSPSGDGKDAVAVSATLFDVFFGRDLPRGKKSMAYHLAFQSDTRTLAADEVARFEADIRKALEAKLGAVVRS